MEDRIDNLKDIRESLIAVYGNDPKFKTDLDEIVKAINERIRLLK